MKIYNAGPFFNEAQREMNRMITDAFRMHDHDVFAPLEQDAVKIDSPEQAAKVFAMNMDRIDLCELMIAHIDWLLPEDDEVRVVKPTSTTRADETPWRGKFKSPPLNIPDPGTVYEMGYAYHANIDVVGFSVYEDKPLNLMLTQGCQGFVQGWDTLCILAEALTMKPLSKCSSIHEWKGKQT